MFSERQVRKIFCFAESCLEWNQNWSCKLCGRGWIWSHGKLQVLTASWYSEKNSHRTPWYFLATRNFKWTHSTQFDCEATNPDTRVSNVSSPEVYKSHQTTWLIAGQWTHLSRAPRFPTHSIQSITRPGYTGQSLQFAWLTLSILHRRQFFKLISHVNLVWAANSSTFSYSDGKKQWNPSRVNPNTGLSFPQQVEAIISWCFSPSSSRILLSGTESACWDVGWNDVEPETKTMSSSICLSQEASQPK